MLRFSSKRLLGMASGNMAAPAVQVVPRFYHERVIDHYNNPRNVGSFDKNDPTVGTGLVGAPACGDVMKLQIKVDEKTGKVVDACFKTFGCGSAIASSSLGSFSSFYPWFLFLGNVERNSDIFILRARVIFFFFFGCPGFCELMYFSSFLNRRCYAGFVLFSL